MRANLGLNQALQVCSPMLRTCAPMAGHGFVTDLNGIQVNTAIGSDGSYRIDLLGMAGPFLTPAANLA